MFESIQCLPNSYQQHCTSDFLVPNEDHEVMLAKWCPELAGHNSNRTKTRNRLWEGELAYIAKPKAHIKTCRARHKAIAKAASVSGMWKCRQNTGGELRWKGVHREQWKIAKSKRQRHIHEARLQDNFPLPLLSPRTQECLSIELCRWDVGDPSRLFLFDLQASSGRGPKGSGICQLPLGVGWIWLPDALAESLGFVWRFQCGIESLPMQGWDVRDFNSTVPGRPSCVGSSCLRYAM